MFNTGYKGIGIFETHGKVSSPHALSSLNFETPFRCTGKMSYPKNIVTYVLHPPEVVAGIFRWELIHLMGG